MTASPRSGERCELSGWLRPPLLNLSIEVLSGQGGYSDD